MGIEVFLVKLDHERISVLGKEYYTEEYVTEMMRREYQRGRYDGQQTYVARIIPMENTVLNDKV